LSISYCIELSKRYILIYSKVKVKKNFWEKVWKRLDKLVFWAYTRGIFGVVLSPYFTLKNRIETTIEAFQIFFSFGRVEGLHSILAVAFTSFLAG